METKVFAKSSREGSAHTDINAIFNATGFLLSGKGSDGISLIYVFSGPSENEKTFREKLGQVDGIQVEPTPNI